MNPIKPPVGIFSVEFKRGIPLRDPATDRPINDKIQLRDPVMDEPITVHPHWIRGRRNEPAAYVRGSSITLEVVFVELYATNLAVDLKAVYAHGTGRGIHSTPLTIGFDGDTGLSDVVRLELAAPLPDVIGVHEYSFDWYVRCEEDKTDKTFLIGSTTHTFYTTWKPMHRELVQPGEHLPRWAYEPMMRWSCSWAAGQQEDKAICDALIKHLPESGLIYGLDGDGQTVRGLLLRGGGMCGAWYQFFQQLVYCQGVYVFRRDMTIVAETRGHNQLWNGAVATAGGLNQPYPDVDPYCFFEDNICFPIGATPVAIEAVEERWYVFEGWKSEFIGVESTHAVNFFVDHDGQVYLYDPSFGDGPYKLEGPVPKQMEIMKGKSLETFKAMYLDKRFPYLVGSIRNGDGKGDKFYKTDWNASPPQYGLLVRTDRILPDDIQIAWSVNT